MKHVPYILLVTLVFASTARADDGAWELDAFGGYGRIAFPATDLAAQSWANGGPAFAVSAAYRGHHFTHPFIDVAYVPMLWSSRNVFLPTSASGTATTAENASWALGIMLGPGFDIDWLRLRAGIGVYDVSVRTTVLDQTNTSSKLSIGFLASAALLVLRADAFALGIEARMAALEAPTAGIYQSSWSVGLTGRWDFVH